MDHLSVRLVDMLVLLPFLYFLTDVVNSKPHTSVPNVQLGWSGNQVNSTLDEDIVARNVKKDKKYLWPNGWVPYEIDFSTFDRPRKQVLEPLHEAMDEIRNVLIERGKRSVDCKIEFSLRTANDTDYLVIKGSTKEGCRSQVGRKGGRQNMTLGPNCFNRATLLHELLHVLGMKHQQSAHNRNQYVTINIDNVKPGHEHNYYKLNSADYTSFGVEYDFDSIMHYSSKGFAKRDNDGKPVGPVISPRDPKIKLKRTRKLSDGDKTKLNFMYCSKFTPPGWRYQKEENK